MTPPIRQPFATYPTSETPSEINTHDGVDAYFSADVETDGAIPGPFSMLSFGLVYAGSYDGIQFKPPREYDCTLYCELRPISDHFESKALEINQLNRDRLLREGERPEVAMTAATTWVKQIAGQARPVLVAYPLSFDWTFLYWYFVRYSAHGSPFSHSSCFDMKTAIAVKNHIPIARAGRSRLASLHLESNRPHTHNALDDAIEQAEIFARLFRKARGGRRHRTEARGATPGRTRPGDGN